MRIIRRALRQCQGRREGRPVGGLGQSLRVAPRDQPALKRNQSMSNPFRGETKMPFSRGAVLRLMNQYFHEQTHAVPLRSSIKTDFQLYIMPCCHMQTRTHKHVPSLRVRRSERLPGIGCLYSG